MLRCRFAAFVMRMMTVLPSAIWTSLCLLGLRPAGVNGQASGEEGEMDSQVKRGFLDACVLATIARGDSYGYRIVKGAPTALGLSESTLYPILRRLKASGHVTEYAQEHNGRTRKYYSITPQGRGWLAAFVAQKSEIEDVLRYIEGGVNRD